MRAPASWRCPKSPADWDARRDATGASRTRPSSPSAAADAARRAAHEYMLYQALIGAWPRAAPTTPSSSACRPMRSRPRARASRRRAGPTRTRTTRRRCSDSSRALLDPTGRRTFLASFGAFAARTALLGALNSLSQLALKALLPGVPDFYQGTELWDFSLVDPDNRRPVDFDRAGDLLTGKPVRTGPTSPRDWRDGRIKLALTQRLLHLRREFAGLFERGSYEPLTVCGRHATHVIAFARSWKRQRVVFAIGRHFSPLTGGGRHWPRGWDAIVEPGDTENLCRRARHFGRRSTARSDSRHVVSDGATERAAPDLTGLSA